MLELPNSSLIICSRNRPDMLVDTVHSILSGETLPTEIVIIDQSDQVNPTLSALGSECGSEINYIHTDRVGVSLARNLGLKAARCDMFLLMDDDMFIDSGWHRAMVTALIEGGLRSVVSGQVLPIETSEDGNFAPSTKIQETPEVYRGKMEKDILYGGNFGIFRTALEEVGFFDERIGAGTPFPAAEDSDYGYRLLEHGYPIIYVPQAIVYHRAWRPKKDFIPLRRKYGTGRGGFYAKHFSLSDRHMLKRMFTDVRTHLAAVPGKLRTDRNTAYGNLALSIGIIVGAVKWLVMYGPERNRP